MRFAVQMYPMFRPASLSAAKRYPGLRRGSAPPMQLEPSKTRSGIAWACNDKHLAILCHYPAYGVLFQCLFVYRVSSTVIGWVQKTIDRRCATTSRPETHGKVRVHAYKCICPAGVPPSGLCRIPKIVPIRPHRLLRKDGGAPSSHAHHRMAGLQRQPQRGRRDDARPQRFVRQGRSLLAPRQFGALLVSSQNQQNHSKSQADLIDAGKSRPPSASSTPACTDGKPR